MDGAVEMKLNSMKTTHRLVIRVLSYQGSEAKRNCGDVEWEGLAM